MRAIRTTILIALTLGLAGSLAAQSPTPVPAPAQATPHRQMRQDRREARIDRHEVHASRRELRQDRARGAGRAEIARDHRLDCRPPARAPAAGPAQSAPRR